MGPRKCTVDGCKSVAGRQQHRGVTFHTFPNNPTTRQNWLNNCRFSPTRNITKSVLICSRHFRRLDFQPLKNNKYLLKPGAEPTIFPWTQSANAGTATTSASGGDSGINTINMSRMDVIGVTEGAYQGGTSNMSKMSSEERVVNQILADAIRGELKSPMKRSASADVVSIEPKPKQLRKSLDSAMFKNSLNAVCDPTSLFRPGAKIEAQDFNEMWHPAEVVEVDQDDREVLIHFETTNIKLIDEWIPMNSSRLRATQANTSEATSHSQMQAIDELPEIASPNVLPLETLQQQFMQPSPLQPNLPVLKKAPYNYVVGEKCMAKWTDSRRWRATVQTVLELDYYDVLFDDGYTKRCHAKDMSKIKRQPPIVSPNQTPPPAKPVTSTGRKINPPLPIPKFDLSTLDLLPVPKDGEWCCNWVNDTPIGAEGYLEGPDGSRRPTVLVDDWRLPPGWTKHLYQRSSVSGKWDVVLVGPSKKRFRSKNDVKIYLDENNIPYNPDVYDFSIHKRRAKDLGLFVFTKEYKEAMVQKQQQLLQNIAEQRQNTPISDVLNTSNISSEEMFIGFPPTAVSGGFGADLDDSILQSYNTTQLEDGYVYVGSLKVLLVDNLFHCPEKSCNKNFRKESHLQIHVKHYHEELAKQMGDCLNMSDLAYIRTTGEMPMDEGQQTQSGIPSKVEGAKPALEGDLNVSIGSPAAVNYHHDETATDPEITFARPESPPPLSNEVQLTTSVADQILRIQARERSHHKKYKKSAKSSKNRIKIKLKNRGGSHKSKSKGSNSHRSNFRNSSRSTYSSDTNLSQYDYDDPPYRGHYESGHSSGTFKSNRLKYLNNQISALSDTNGGGALAGEATVNAPPATHFIDENGELIKIVRMRQEEIINCICAYAEEDGLMIQCELCLCWQHGFCHGIEKESLVPDKYVCYICQNPQSGRASMKYIHDQEWLYEGRLQVATKHAVSVHEPGLDETPPTVPPKHKERFDKLKNSHRLTGNLLDLKRFMHSLQVKINIAENKDHPKMYLWAKKWERSPPPCNNEVPGIEPLAPVVVTSSASEDKKIIMTDTMLNDILHEEDEKKVSDVKQEFPAADLPTATVDEVLVINDLLTNVEAIKHMEKAAEEIAKTEIKDEADVVEAAANDMKSPKLEQDSAAGAEIDGNILDGLLTSPGGTNIDLVNDIKMRTPSQRHNNHVTPNIPQPEAAIDPIECQLRLLSHIQKQQALAMSRLQSIEAEIIGLEAMDENPEPVDPNDSFSSTKQTIFQLLTELTKIRKLAAINMAEDDQLAKTTAVL